MKKNIFCAFIMTFLAVSSFAQVPLVDRMTSLLDSYFVSNDEGAVDNVPGMIALAENATTEEINMRTAQNTEGGKTAIMLAVLYSSSEKVTKLLLEKGADVTLHDAAGRSVLEIASLFYIERPVIELLLNAGVPQDDIIKVAKSDKDMFIIIKEWAEKNSKTELLARLLPMEQQQQQQAAQRTVKSRLKKLFNLR